MLAKKISKKTNGPKIKMGKGTSKKTKVKIKQPTEPKPHN